MSPYLRNIQAPFTVDTAETSTFGNTFKTYVPGLTDGSLSLDGIYDGAANAVDFVFDAALAGVGTDRFTVLIQGDTLGASGFGFESTTTNYQVTAGIGDVAQVTLQAQNNMGKERGIVLHPLTQETADSAGSTSVDQTTVSTTTGWSAYLHITQAAATMTSVEIQDSADNAAFLDITGAAFTTLTAVSSQRIVSAPGATVRRYVRLQWDLTTNATFHVLFCRGTNPVS
jgi:hypothetical protein